MDSKLTKYLALDCEMVDTGTVIRNDVIARVSIVNEELVCVYDKYVKPKDKVTNYRTPLSGVKKSHLDGGKEFEIVQKEVKDILKGRIVVGHSLRYDFAVLKIEHPIENIRDTALYLPFEKMSPNQRTPSLKFLALRILGLNIQTGQHSSVEDAKAVMKIYKSVSRKWEASLRDINFPEKF